MVEGVPVFRRSQVAKALTRAGVIMDSMDFLNIFICLTGLALHFAMKWAEARKDTPTPIGFRAYAASVPAVTAVAILSSIGAFAVTWAMDWLNPGMAFACGYMGNSIADNIASQSSKL